MRYTSFYFLCPKHRAAFEALARAVRPLGLHVFETYRNAEEQNAAFARGASKARAGQSPHQHGMAVDFVPRVGVRGWYWPPADHNIWRQLRLEAQRQGLHNDIAWDRPHVECRCWRDLRKPMVQTKSAAG